MGIQIIGAGGTVADVGAFGASPLHVTTKPTPYGTLGHFAVTAITGTIAAGMAANGSIFIARWTDATRFAVIYEVALLTFRNITTAFAAGVYEFNLSVGRSWTTAPSGGTALTLTGDNQSLRTSMGASLFGSMIIATTAALTDGTTTFDSRPHGSTYGSTGTTPVIGKGYIPNYDAVAGGGGDGVILFQRDPGNEHPIILAQNEGIAVKGTVPATGTWVAAVRMKWAEVTAF